MLIGRFAPSVRGSQVAPLNVPSGSVDLPHAGAAAPSVSADVGPLPFIRGWSFHNEREQGNLQHGSEVALDPGCPEIIVFFDAARRDGRTEFRYRLDDYDGDWTETLGGVAHYRRLTPGRYRFEVQARTVGQPWTKAEAVLKIRQRPFFYQDVVCVSAGVPGSVGGGGAVAEPARPVAEGTDGDRTRGAESDCARVP